MKTALLTTIGFDEKFCYRAILRHGIKEGDVVVLITGKIVERVQKACEWVQQLLRTSYGEKAKVEIVELDVKNVLNSIKTVSSKIEELEGYDIIVNLSGGMRALIAIVLLACIKSSKPVRVEIETEDFESLIEIPEKLLSLVKTTVGEDKMEVLRAIASGCREAGKIAAKLGKDASTVRRHIAALEKMGLVEVEKRKPMVVRLTELAELAL